MYGADFAPLAVIDDFSSLQWRRRYCEPGEFELHLSGERFADVSAARYVGSPELAEMGVIRALELAAGETGSELTVRGGFLESLLYGRVALGQGTYCGAASTVIRALVDECMISCPDAERRLAGLALAQETAPLGGEVSVQPYGRNLGEVVYAICAEQELSVRLERKPSGGLEFSVWQGRDRSDGQSAEPWAVFAEEFENVASSVYARSVEERRSVAYVVGEDDGTHPVITEQVDVSEADEAERRELFVNAGSIRRRVDGALMAESAYRALLRGRGLEALGQYAGRLTLECEACQRAGLAYGRDYDLGDRCTFRSEAAGVTADARITAVTLAYEHGAITVAMTLGSGAPGIVRRILREVRY